MRFVRIDDNAVRHVWRSPTDHDEMAYIYPDWYAQHGTPSSSDGYDMEYLYTEVAESAINGKDIAYHVWQRAVAAGEVTCSLEDFIKEWSK